jgi:hypothetical protein
VVTEPAGGTGSRLFVGPITVKDEVRDVIPFATDREREARLRDATSDLLAAAR